MTFVVSPQQNEEVYVQKEFYGSNSHVFAMAVSNQALYLSAQKWALKDTWYLKRVPLQDVTDVRLVKQKATSIFLASACLTVIGGLTSFFMLWNAYFPTPGSYTRSSGWPIAIFVGGIVIPFIARGRQTLVVRMKQGKFKWRPQLAVDRTTRQLCSDIQRELIGVCRKVGLQTIES